MDNFKEIITATLAIVEQNRLLSHIGLLMLCSIIMLLVVLVDLWDGVYTARKIGERVHSHKLRVTFEKIGEYWRVLVLGYVTDTLGIFFPFYALPYLSIVITVGVAGIEIKSIFEHIKRRKSGLKELPDLAAKIVNCSSAEGAKEIIDFIKNHKK